MPAYKHPCPHCGNFILRDVAMCPFCGTADPFAPARCASCGRVVEDPRWVACPSCGKPLGVASATPAVSGAAGASGDPGMTAGSQPGGGTAGSVADPGSSRVAVCTGCGAALPTGARFCTICGTLAG